MMKINLSYDIGTDEVNISVGDGGPVDLPCLKSGTNKPIRDWIKSFFPDVVSTLKLGFNAKCEFKYHGTLADFVVFEKAFEEFLLTPQAKGINFAVEKELADISTNYRAKIEKLSQKLEEVSNLYPDDEKFQKLYKEHKKEMVQYKDLADTCEIQVAIVGAIKAGKSTLINAILGDDIASVDVIPETATLSIFKASEKNYIKIFFYTDEDWNDIWPSAKPESIFVKEYEKLNAENERNRWLNRETLTFEPKTIVELKNKAKEYSSKASAVHYFVKKLEIGLQKYGNEESPLPKELVLVDTPGLNDVVAYRAEITKKYINRANAAVVCVFAGAMQREEYLTIQKTFDSIGPNKNKIIVLGTQTDLRSKPEEDWRKQKGEWTTYLKGLYGNEQSLETNIIGISAKVFSSLQKIKHDIHIDDVDMREISNFADKSGIKGLTVDNTSISERIKNVFLPVDQHKIILASSDKLLEHTGIDHLLKRLNSILSDREKILAEDLECKYNGIEKHVNETVYVLKKDVEEQLDLLDKDMNQKRAKIDEKQAEIDKTDNYRKQLEDAFEKMEKALRTETEKMREQLNAFFKMVTGGK